METGADEVCEFGEIGSLGDGTGEKEWKMLELIQKSDVADLDTVRHFYRVSGNGVLRVDGCLSGGAGAAVGCFKKFAVLHPG